MKKKKKEGRDEKGQFTKGHTPKNINSRTSDGKFATSKQRDDEIQRLNDETVQMWKILAGQGRKRRPRKGRYDHQELMQQVYTTEPEETYE